MLPPDIEAVREFDAAVAAAEGSRELGFSCIVLGICVGE